MFMVIVETQNDAEARAGRSAYLAKLVKGPNEAVEEEPGLEVVNCEKRRALAMLAWPGEFFWRGAGGRSATRTAAAKCSSLSMAMAT